MIKKKEKRIKIIESYQTEKKTKLTLSIIDKKGTKKLDINI